MTSTLEQSPAHRAVATGANRLDQDVWWTGRDGTTRLIDDLSDDHRRFIARMLVDDAAVHYARIRRRQIFLQRAHEQLYAHDVTPITDSSINAQVRREQEQGLHLLRVRESLLFRRMIRDLDWTHPGVNAA